MSRAILLLFALAKLATSTTNRTNVWTELKAVEIRTDESNFFLTKPDVQSVTGADDQQQSVLADNGYGNVGDLIYRYRESHDGLQIREVIVLPEISSEVQEVQWYAITQARRITSVRVLNFGRERAYTLRIDVAGNEVQTILRIPPNYDPRIMIEIYGLV